MNGLEAQSVVAGYKDMMILFGVHVQALPGQVTVVLGPNGAGKSTLLKVLAGLIRPTEGHILLNGQDITDLSPAQRLRRGIGVVPQAHGTFSNMTVYENLLMGAFLRRDDFSDTLNRVESYFPILRQRRNQLAGTMSGGEQQMVAMGRALMMEPSVLLLDEPSAGLAPKVIEEVFRTVRNIADEGVAVLMVEQNVRQALEIADRAYILASGRNRLEGPAKELLDDPQVGAIYLGESS